MAFDDFDVKVGASSLLAEEYDDLARKTKTAVLNALYSVGIVHKCCVSSRAVGRYRGPIDNFSCIQGYSHPYDQCYPMHLSQFVDLLQNMMQHQSFFHQFAAFEPDGSAAASTEFERLARFMQWKPKSKKYRNMRRRCLGSEFSRYYGDDASQLQNWQALCHELHVRVPTESITQCKKALKSVYVNIVDLVDCRRTGAHIKRFPSNAELRKYTMNDRTKIFPKETAKEDGFLKALLRDIF